MKLTLIRHTSLQIEPGICYGQSDIDVAVSFADELARTQAKLTGIGGCRYSNASWAATRATPWAQSSKSAKLCFTLLRLLGCNF